MTPILFNLLDDHAILYHKNGSYKQSRLALRRGTLYVESGSSFLMMYAKGVTSNPAVRWVDLEHEDNYITGKLGRLMASWSET